MEQITAILQARWPKAFDLQHPLPLKVDVHKDIMDATGMPEETAREWLKWWANRIEYHEGVALANSHRFDLNGKTVEPVAKNHRCFARLQVKKLKTGLTAH